MDDLSGAACIPNIGPAERRKRRLFGAAMLIATLAALVALVATDVPRGWRLILFVPMLMGALSVLQARAQTCVALAAQGRRNLDRGPEAIGDADELRRVRMQARRVYLQAGLLASGVTALLLMWP